MTTTEQRSTNQTNIPHEIWAKLSLMQQNVLNDKYRHFSDADFIGFDGVAAYIKTHSSAPLTGIAHTCRVITKQGRILTIPIPQED